MSYSFDILKQAIEFMATQQVTIKSEMDDLKNKMNDQDDKVSLSVFNQFALATNNKLDNHQDKLSEHDAEIKLLKELGRPAGDGNSSGLLDTLKEMIKNVKDDLTIKINNVQNDLNVDIELLKSDFDSLKQEIENLKNKD